MDLPERRRDSERGRESDKEGERAREKEKVQKKAPPSPEALGGHADQRGGGGVRGGVGVSVRAEIAPDLMAALFDCSEQSGDRHGGGGGGFTHQRETLKSYSGRGSKVQLRLGLLSSRAFPLYRMSNLIFMLI